MAHLIRSRPAALLWIVPVLLVVIVIGIPLLAVLFSLDIAAIRALAALFASEVALNSLLLLVTAGLVSLLFGLPAAWLTATTSFPGRMVLEVLLVLPLAIPAYIIAYTYKGIFGPFGTVMSWWGWYVEVDNLPVLAVLMAAVLYPYVCLVCRSLFLRSSTRLLEAARTMGVSRNRAFFRLALPLARPALAAGLFLVGMEVLNDYGAVSYFGIRTFTTEIIRQWNPLDLQPVVRMAVSLLLAVILILWLEKRWRKQARYDEKLPGRLAQHREPLRGGKAALAIIVCAIPVIIGAVIPVLQLLAWAAISVSRVLDADFFTMMLNTFGLAAGAAVGCVLLSLLVHYVNRLFPGRLLTSLSGLSAMGYAIPGAVIGVGILVPVAWINREFNWLLTGTTGLLIYGYVVRFLAVSHQTIESGWAKQPRQLHEVARSLGSGPWRTLFRVELPLLRPAMLA
ncbi:MAG: iron ABC transporter permease, partial [Bacteroidota bacterium]